MKQKTLVDDVGASQDNAWTVRTTHLRSLIALRVFLDVRVFNLSYCCCHLVVISNQYFPFCHDATIRLLLKTSKCTARGPLRHAALSDNNKLLITDYHKNEAFPLMKCIGRYCRIGRWSFLSWFDVNRSTFDEECTKNDLRIFVPSDLDLWPSDLKFAPLVAPVRLAISTKLEVYRAFIFREKRRHGADGQTYGRTDGVQRLMPPPPMKSRITML